MLTSKPAWAAVMTYPNAELTVARHFEDYDSPIEYYLPMMANRRQGRKKNAPEEQPMFPCYIFVRINNKQVYQTRTTKGVLYIVSSDHSIIEVPESDIEAVRRFEATQRNIYIHETSSLRKGAKATILSGEFAGMTGTIIKGCKDGNFAVSIGVLNMSFVCHVKRAELKAAQTEGVIEQ